MLHSESDNIVIESTHTHWGAMYSEWKIKKMGLKYSSIVYNTLLKLTPHWWTLKIDQHLVWWYDLSPPFFWHERVEYFNDIQND